MERKLERLFTWFLLFFFLVLFVTTWQYGAKARLAPLVFLTPALVLTVVCLFRVSRIKHSPFPVAEEGEGDSFEVDAPFGEEVKMMVWFVLFALLIWLVGFLVATFVFMMVYLRLWAREGWVLSMILALSSTLFIYLVVEVGFKIILYRGWIFS